MWMRTLALIALAPALAFAKTSVSRSASAGDPEVEVRDNTATVILGAPGQDIAIDKLRVVIAPADETSRSVRLVFTLSTTVESRRQAVLPLGLPRGARITGGAVSIGNDPRMIATAMAPDLAREEYQAEFRNAKDPLLVELADPLRDVHAIANDAFEPPSETRDQFDAFAPAPPNATTRDGHVNYVVRAFPLTNRDNARVELTIELPDDALRLAISHAQPISIVELHRASGTTVDVRRRQGVRSAITMDLPAQRAMPVSVATLADRAYVDAERSLYAGFAPAVVRRGPVPTVTIDGPRPVQSRGFIDKTMIRRTVKQHMAQLGRCYTRVTEYRGGPEGTAVMHFSIAQDGSIADAFVDGELEDPRITECLAAVIAGWRFSPGDATVMVHYPLHFRLAKS